MSHLLGHTTCSLIIEPTRDLVTNAVLEKKARDMISRIIPTTCFLRLEPGRVLAKHSFLVEPTRA